jgi:hypothetical protein
MRAKNYVLRGTNDRVAVEALYGCTSDVLVSGPNLVQGSDVLEGQQSKSSLKVDLEVKA